MRGDRGKSVCSCAIFGVTAPGVQAGKLSGALRIGHADLQAFCMFSRHHWAVLTSVHVFPSARCAVVSAPRPLFGGGKLPIPAYFAAVGACSRVFPRNRGLTCIQLLEVEWQFLSRCKNF